MTEDTKELVKALVEGFSNSVNKLSDKFATKEDLKHEINQVEGRLMKAMKDQTTILLTVLKKYEAMTEDHDKTLKNIRDSFNKDKK